MFGDLVYYFNQGNKAIQLTKKINSTLNLNINPSYLDKAMVTSQSLLDMVKGLTARQYSYGLLGLSNLIKEFNTNKKLDPILKVLNKEVLFIAQIAEASSSDEVAAIIENFAAPVGSWRDKRNARWNVAFDSYVGLGGYWPLNVDDLNAKFGVPTPIGFSLTTPANFFSIMGSIVDIGPMVAFRFLNDEDNVPDTYFKEIFAPGVFLSLNLDKISSKDFILKLNGGYQQFPLLEKTTVNNNEVSLVQKSGWTASVNVNIPIMTLYNKN